MRSWEGENGKEVGGGKLEVGSRNAEVGTEEKSEFVGWYTLNKKNLHIND